MSGSPMSQQSTTFDMNPMLHAIASFRSKDPFHNVPSEILVGIFHWLLNDSRQLDKVSTSSMIPSMLVSHVCRRWRQIVIDFPTLWTYLEMNSVRHPDILSDLISRSKQHPFAISIKLPLLNIDNSSHEVQAQFRQGLKILKKNVGRLTALRVLATNATLYPMLNFYLKDFTFPRLELLSLTQVDSTVRRYTFGPMAFNPSCFNALILNNLAIDCDASCLAGLHLLHLVKSSGMILEQTQLSHSTYPAIPNAPVMNRLIHLIIDGTNLLPKVPSIALPLPSFDSSRLRTLHLAQLTAPTLAAEDLVGRLFDIACGPRLESLFVDTLDDASFSLFIRKSAANATPKFQRVRRLGLARVNLSLVVRDFLAAFPNVVELALFATDSTKILSFLADPALMPLLRGSYVDNVLHRRVFMSSNLPSATN